MVSYRASSVFPIKNMILAAGAVGIFAADIERALVDLRIAERIGMDSPPLSDCCNVPPAIGPGFSSVQPDARVSQSTGSGLHENDMESVPRRSRGRDLPGFLTPNPLIPGLLDLSRY